MNRSDDPAPSHATVYLLTPDGEEHALIPGDLIGRMHTAALHLDDGRVSEAHAMVSLRDGSLRLLSLRGGFSVGRGSRRAGTPTPRRGSGAPAPAGP